MRVCSGLWGLSTGTTAAMTRRGILWRGIVSRKAGAGIGVAGVVASAGVSTLLTFGTSMCIFGRFC